MISFFSPSRRSLHSPTLHIDFAPLAVSAYTTTEIYSKCDVWFHYFSRLSSMPIFVEYLVPSSNRDVMDPVRFQQPPHKTPQEKQHLEFNLRMMAVHAVLQSEAASGASSSLHVSISAEAVTPALRAFWPYDNSYAYYVPKEGADEQRVIASAPVSSLLTLVTQSCCMSIDQYRDLPAHGHTEQMIYDKLVCLFDSPINDFNLIAINSTHSKFIRKVYVVRDNTLARLLLRVAAYLLAYRNGFYSLDFYDTHINCALLAAFFTQSPDSMWRVDSWTPVVLSQNMLNDAPRTGNITITYRPEDKPCESSERGRARTPTPERRARSRSPASASSRSTSRSHSRDRSRSRRRSRNYSHSRSISPSPERKSSPERRSEQAPSSCSTTPTDIAEDIIDLDVDGGIVDLNVDLDSIGTPLPARVNSPKRDLDDKLAPPSPKRSRTRFEDDDEYPIEDETNIEIV